jgi:hypothetical protein
MGKVGSLATERKTFAEQTLPMLPSLTIIPSPAFQWKCGTRTLRSLHITAVQGKKAENDAVEHLSSGCWSCFSAGLIKGRVVAVGLAVSSAGWRWRGLERWRTSFYRGRGLIWLHDTLIDFESATFTPRSLLLSCFSSRLSIKSLEQTWKCFI